MTEGKGIEKVLLSTSAFESARYFMWRHFNFFGTRGTVFDLLICVPFGLLLASLMNSFGNVTRDYQWQVMLQVAHWHLSNENRKLLELSHFENLLSGSCDGF